MFPGVKPFVEVGGDTRIHDLQFDRDGLQRDSKSLTPRVGTTFDIARRLTGEISVGYLTRKFDDPTLPTLAGIVADASLIWNATGLTTVTLIASSKGEETVVQGVSGALRRDIGVQVDHALRRWLIWTVRAGYGLDDYVGASNGTASGAQGHQDVARHRADLQIQPGVLAQGRVSLRPVAAPICPARITTPMSSWSG